MDRKAFEGFSWSLFLLAGDLIPLLTTIGSLTELQPKVYWEIGTENVENVDTGLLLNTLVNKYTCYSQTLVTHKCIECLCWPVPTTVLEIL